jgi:regulator of replication initiation timing
MVHKHNVSEDGIIEISDDIDDKSNYLQIYDSSDLKWLGLAENLNGYCDYLRKKVDELNHDIVELRNENKVLTEDNDRLSNRVKELVIEKQALEKEKFSATPVKFGEYDAPEDAPEPDMEKVKKGLEVLGISIEEKKSDDSTTESMVDHITLSKENEDLKFRLENLQKTNIQYKDDLFLMAKENEKLKVDFEKLQQAANNYEYYKSLVDKYDAAKKERQNKIALLKKLTDILLEDDE